MPDNGNSEKTYILDHNQTLERGSTPNDMQRLVVEEGDGEPQKRFGLSMTTFNFTNSIIGSGIIGIPYTFKQAGFGLGIIVLIFVAFISDYSILLLVEGGGLCNSDSYQEVVRAALGRPGYYVLTALQFLYPFISMVSYNVIIGDTITKIILWLNGGRSSFVQNVLGNRKFVIFLVTLIVTLPLSLYRNIGKLGKWALLSLLMVVFIIVAIAIRLVTFAKDIPPTENAWQFADAGFFQALGIAAFSFMCHHNTLLVHSSMLDPTPKRWGLVLHISFVFSMIVLLFVGLLGYISFTGFTEGDLLENYCRDDVLMNCARFAFTITIMLTYPIECFVTREVVENAMFSPCGQPSPQWRHVTITVLVVFLTAAVAMTTDCLGVVLTFNGVLFAAPLAFVFPSLSVIRLRPPGSLLCRSVIGPALLALFGLLTMIIGTVATVLDTVNGFNTCSHGAEPAYCQPSPVTNDSVIDWATFSPAELWSKP